MFHMRDDAKILAVSSAAALSAVVGALLLARWIVKPLERLRAASAAARRRRSHRPRTAARRPRARAGGRIVQRDGRIDRAALRRSKRARRLGQPRPAHPADVDAGDARGGRRRPRRSRRVPAGPEPSGAHAVDARRRPLRARPHRRRRPPPRAARRRPRPAHRVMPARASRRTPAPSASGSSTQLDAPLPAVRCAPEKVERVLYNLLTNALRHTPADGAIAVVATREPRNVTVAVEDTGDGVTGDVRERMFERFWRGDSSRSSPGSGLGLAIARGLVEAQGAGSGPRTDPKAARGSPSRSRHPAERETPQRAGSCFRYSIRPRMPLAPSQTASTSATTASAASWLREIHSRIRASPTAARSGSA